MPQSIATPYPLPSSLPMVEVDVVVQPGLPPVPVQLPANSPEEAFAMLLSIGEGLSGAAGHSLYYGSVLEPIRDGYKARLEAVEREISQRRIALGPSPNSLELRGLAQWAARQRARTARVMRLPTPALMAGLEARDWNKYGVGGRTFENLVRRKAVERGLIGTAAYNNIIASAVLSNADESAKIAKAAQHLRSGGAVLGVAGLGFTAFEIAQAPPEERGRVATRAGATFVGGLIGGEVAVTLTTIGVGLLLGATPGGWLILGVGLVGGVVGSIITEKVFFPRESEPTARGMEAGYAINALSGSVATAAIGGVTVKVQSGDTQFTLGQRAYRLAAASMGLDSRAQEEFADRHAFPNGLSWAAGDPTPRGGSNTVNEQDISLTAGKEIIFQLNEVQRGELSAAAHR